MSRKRVLVSAFFCKAGGVSEAYSSYKWVEQLAHYNDVTLLTADNTPVPASVKLVQPSKHIRFPTHLLRRINGEMHMDYFWFDHCAKRKLGRDLADFDIVHHLCPIAPRYPSALARNAKNFIIGPIGGSLRSPPAFRREVERSEPFFYKLRGLDRWRLNYDPLLRRTLSAAKCILIAGNYMFDILPEKYHSKCVTMLDTGIDADSVPFNPIKEFEAGTRPINLLYAGRLVPYKGLIYALKAFASLPESLRSAFRFDIVGNQDQSEYEHACRQVVSDQNLKQYVHFYGRISKDEVFKLYERCDLFVFPSLAEAGGNVVIEAMCKARPVLAANCGGPAEVVTPESGFLLDPSSPEGLINAIAAVLHDIAAAPRQLAVKGLAARRIIESAFDWRVKGERLHAIYHTIRSDAPATSLPSASSQ